MAFLRCYYLHSIVRFPLRKGLVFRIRFKMVLVKPSGLVLEKAFLLVLVMSFVLVLKVPSALIPVKPLRLVEMPAIVFIDFILC